MKQTRFDVTLNFESNRNTERVVMRSIIPNTTVGRRVAALFAGACCLGAWFCPSLKAELVGHWTFDEGAGIVAHDSAGGFDATLVGGVSWVPGKVGGGAVYFDGTSGYVEVGGSTNSPLELVGTPYTISWWAKPSGARSHQRMISMDNGEDYKGGYGLYLMSGKNLIWTHNSPGQNKNWDTGFVPTNSMDWVMITAVWDGTNRSLYINGMFLEQLATPGAVTTRNHTDPLWFGAIPKYFQYFSGAMDDIRVYNTALTPDEIMDLLPEPPIVIVTPPHGITARTTTNGVTLTVDAKVYHDRLPASGLRYQWLINGSEIDGATGASYTTPPLDTPNASTLYQVRISHSQLTSVVQSPEVPVTVLDDLQPELIGWWKFDEGSGTSALDSAGGHDGAITGATYVPGRIGDWALSFNGTNDYVEIENSIGSNLELVDTAYTIAWWQKAKGVNGRNQRIINMDSGKDLNGGYAVYLSKTGNILDSHNSGPLVNSWDTGVVAANRWQHVAVVWDRFNRTLYVDGVMVAFQPTFYDLLTRGTDPLWFGKIPQYEQYFAGALDDIRIYSDALSSSEVAELMGPAPMPVALRVFTPQPGKVALAWVASAAGYELEYANNVNASSWTLVPGFPERIDGENVVTLDSSGDTRFFRLRAPQLAIAPSN